MRFNFGLNKENTGYKVCYQCLRSAWNPIASPHNACSLGHILGQTSQVFYEDGPRDDPSMRLNHKAKTANHKLLYMPIHGILAEHIAQAVLS